jgi:hypothetical protein
VQVRRIAAVKGQLEGAVVVEDEEIRDDVALGLVDASVVASRFRVQLDDLVYGPLQILV